MVVFINFIKKRLQHRCFPVKFAKYLRTPILKNIFEWLLLNGYNMEVFLLLIDSTETVFEATQHVSVLWENFEITSSNL